MPFVCTCSQKKLGSVSDEITHHALCNTIVIKVGAAGRSSAANNRLFAEPPYTPMQHRDMCSQQLLSLQTYCSQ